MSLSLARKIILTRHRSTAKYRETRARRNARDRASPEFRAKNAAKVRAWRSRNPEKAYKIARRHEESEKRAEQSKRYKPQSRENSRRWSRTHRATDLCRVHRRVARLRNAPGRGVTAKQWTNILAEALGICAYCNQRRLLTMDHIEPLIRGGYHDVENIAGVCGGCNSAKRDRSLISFLVQRIPTNQLTRG